MDEHLKVLFVDDSDDDVWLVLRSLKASGFKVESKRVETSAGMAEALKERPWDVVLCDYRMPQFTAVEALVLLRKNLISA